MDGSCDTYEKSIRATCTVDDWQGGIAELSAPAGRDRVCVAAYLGGLLVIGLAVAALYFLFGR
ncbi:hypothetical protein D477_006984 [Arthrobacter crystallopoietes BAB-32]|uniref:Uncharacterized protein n=1 Tax=Arthrobacter crystallopoietes BAB-32 TaxID=1246476 RepID=N1UX07_9MICC|nr:hypothetical protein [Arthrobacter crystallopoietes]EMY34931.1 hypothetical protein D477_006984 [Arthrobacter crystallopoietes BAB-32]